MKARILLAAFILLAALGPVGLVPAGPPPAAAASAGTAPAGSSWQTLYEARGVGIAMPGERDLAVDASGNFHLVYGGAGLFYAFQMDGGWRYEPVDAGPTVGGGASLALDGAGTPHICYPTSDPATVRHAWHNARGTGTPRRCRRARTPPVPAPSQWARGTSWRSPTG